MCRLEMALLRLGCSVVALFAEGSWPGGCPACNSLSFASPKESKQRKGDPGSCVPSLRYGQPAVLGSGGVSLNSPSAQTTRSLIRLNLRSSANPQGVGTMDTK